MKTSQTELQIIEHKPTKGAFIYSGQRIWVHYNAAFTLDDLDQKDKIIETSWHKKPINFIYGNGEVLKGIEMGMKDMRVASTRRLVLPANLCFGLKGIKGKIPPNSNLAFEIYIVKTG